MARRRTISSFSLLAGICAPTRDQYARTSDARAVAAHVYPRADIDPRADIHAHARGGGGDGCVCQHSGWIQYPLS